MNNPLDLIELDSLVYPWQRPCAQAAIELDSVKLPMRIAAAETAVNERIRELGGGFCSPDELQALRDAQSMLSSLRRYAN